MPALTGFFFFFCLFLLNCQCRLHDFACEGGKRTDFKGFIYVHTHRFIVLTVISVNTALLPISFVFFWFLLVCLFCFIFLFLAVFHPPPQCHFK